MPIENISAQERAENIRKNIEYIMKKGNISKYADLTELIGVKYKTWGSFLKNPTSKSSAKKNFCEYFKIDPYMLENGSLEDLALFGSPKPADMPRKSNICILTDMDSVLNAGPTHKIGPEMAEILVKLAAHYRIGVITGQTYAKICEKVINPIKEIYNGFDFSSFHLLPTQGLEIYQYNSDIGDFEKIFEEKLNDDVMDRVEFALREAAEGHYVEGLSRIERRGGGQVTLVLLTDEKSTREMKQEYDRDRKIRNAIAARVEELIPGVVAVPGGTTSVDVSKAGKQFGYEKIAGIWGVKPSQILCFCDEAYEGGNDYALVKAGAFVRTIRFGWRDTLIAFKDLIELAEQKIF